MEKPKSIAQIAREHGFTPKTIYMRMQRKGMTLEEALQIPTISKAERMRQVRASFKGESIRLSKLKTYKVTSPDGKVTIVKDLPAFCKQMGWKRTSLARGVYKGWLINRIVEDAEPTN